MTTYSQPERRQAKQADAHGTVEFLLRRMRHKGELPTFSRHVIEINNKLSSLTTINFSSAGDLAKIILKDFSLTNKLLKVVNSAFYANLSGKVTTISKAVFLLGVEKVRMLAAALMIFDHLGNKSQAAELKHMALQSFMSGMVAMNVANTLKIGGKEEIFICAMLHNLGKILVICYFPEEYEEIQTRMQQQNIDEEKASISVLGISYNDLGIAISRSWNFPDKITGSMAVFSPGSIDPPITGHDMLRIVANFANELLLCTAKDQGSDPPEELSELSKRYERSIPIPLEKMMSLVEINADNLEAYSDIVAIDRQTIKMLDEKLRPSGAGNTIPREGKSGSADIVGSRETASGATAADRATTAQFGILDNGLREIKDTIRNQSNLSDVIFMILETMYRGLGFDLVIFCLRHSDAQPMMIGRFGLGDNADDFVRIFRFPIGEHNDIFNIAVSQAKGITIDDVTAPNVVKNIPKWYRDAFTAPSFLIYPLLVKGLCIGMFYADKKIKGSLLTESQIRYMEELRNLAIQAIEQKS